MSNLTSTVPGAFNTLYNLLNAAGQAQTPQVSVYHSELQQQEPSQYVLLEGARNHHFEPAALGSYAQYETYELFGYATYLQGNVDPMGVLTATWALYQAVVMNTVVLNRGQPGPVLGAGAPSGLEWIVPGDAEYSGAAGQFADGTGGFAGRVDFCYTLKARITVP